MYLTFSDLLDHALAYLGGDAARANSDRARRAVLAAMQDLPGRHDWAYYQTFGRVNTSGSYTTGTVEYDHTGGASERLVTLTGGTWPSWAAAGTLLVGDVPYEVAERLDGTTLTLEAATNPGEDLAAGTAYTLYRDTYAVPADLLASYEVVVDAVGYRLLHRRASEWAQLRRLNNGPSKPEFFCLTGDGAAGGGLAMRLWPPPDDEYALDFLYKRRPRALAIDRKEAGTASVSGTAVTGSGTAFTTAMEGSVIRLSDSPTVSPTGAAGNDPAAVEGVIESVASATSLTLTAAASQALSGVKYVVSDPVDVDQNVHARLLYRMIERQCRVMTRMKELPEESREYEKALAEARELNSAYAGRRAAGGGFLARRRLADHPVGTEFE